MIRFFAVLSCVAALFAFTGSAFAQDTYVNGYYRGNGTYVQPHMRSAPDSNPYNNYSTKGNVNPYTGEQGTKSPYSSGSSYGSTYGSSNKNSGNSLSDPWK